MEADNFFYPSDRELERRRAIVALVQKQDKVWNQDSKGNNRLRERRLGGIPQKQFKLRNHVERVYCQLLIEEMSCRMPPVL